MGIKVDLCSMNFVTKQMSTKHCTRILSFSELKNRISKMAVSAVCLHHKFGYCKYGNHCRLKHVHLVCQNTNCDVQKCNYRHPRHYSYFTQFGQWEGYFEGTVRDGLCRHSKYCSKWMKLHSIV